METASAMESNRESTASVGVSVETRTVPTPRQPRVCGCGRREGEIVMIDGETKPLVVNRAFIDRDRDGEPLLRYLCRICINGGVKGMKIYDTVKLHAALHKQWEERQKAKMTAIEAARKRRAEEQARERAAIEAALMAVVAGTAKELFVSCEEKDGIWRCVRPGCSCQKMAKGQPRPIRAIAVIGGEIRRVCAMVAGVIFDLQAKGVREVAVWSFGLPGDAEPGKRSFEEAASKCRRHLDWLKHRSLDRDKTKRVEPEPDHPTFVPVGPKVLPTEIQQGASRAAEAARERNDRCAAAYSLGLGLADVVDVKADEASDDNGWGAIEAFNRRSEATCAGHRKKGGKKDGKDGGKDKDGRRRR